MHTSKGTKVNATNSDYFGRSDKLSLARNCYAEPVQKRLLPDEPPNLMECSGASPMVKAFYPRDGADFPDKAPPGRQHSDPPAGSPRSPHRGVLRRTEVAVKVLLYDVISIYPPKR